MRCSGVWDLDFIISSTMDSRYFFMENLAHTNSHKAHGVFGAALYLSFLRHFWGFLDLSSANFVEEQQHEGVFKKNASCMTGWRGYFNPLIALVVLNSIPV